MPWKVALQLSISLQELALPQKSRCKGMIIGATDRLQHEPVPKECKYKCRVTAASWHAPLPKSCKYNARVWYSGLLQQAGRFIAGGSWWSWFSSWPASTGQCLISLAKAFTATSLCNNCICSQENCPYIELSLFRSNIAVEMQCWVPSFGVCTTIVALLRMPV